MGNRHNNEDDRTDQERAPEPESARSPEPVRPPEPVRSEPHSDLKDAPDTRISAPGVETSEVEQGTLPPVDVVPAAQAVAPEREIKRVERDFDDARERATTPSSGAGSWWKRLWKRT